jgi:hypothetical protein
LALGICDAFRDAELLADALDDGLAGRRDITDALAGYEVRRNEATLPDYRMNLDRARFTPVPQKQREMRAALHGNASATRQFLLSIEQMMPQAELTTN